MKFGTYVYDEKSGDDRYVEFKQLSVSDRVYGDCKYDDNWTRTFRVVAPYGLSEQGIWMAIRRCYEYHCHCSHDCCGHVSSGVSSIRRLRRREWLVVVSYSVNC